MSKLDYTLLAVFAAGCAGAPVQALPVTPIVAEPEPELDCSNQTMQELEEMLSMGGKDTVQKLKRLASKNPKIQETVLDADYLAADGRSIGKFDFVYEQMTQHKDGVDFSQERLTIRVDNPGEAINEMFVQYMDDKLIRVEMRDNEGKVMFFYDGSDYQKAEAQNIAEGVVEGTLRSVIAASQDHYDACTEIRNNNRMQIEHLLGVERSNYSAPDLKRQRAPNSTHRP